MTKTITLQYPYGRTVYTGIDWSGVERKGILQLSMPACLAKDKRGGTKLLDKDGNSFVVNTGTLNEVKK